MEANYDRQIRKGKKMEKAGGETGYDEEVYGNINISSTLKYKKQSECNKGENFKEVGNGK